MMTSKPERDVPTSGEFKTKNEEVAENEIPKEKKEADDEDDVDFVLNVIRSELKGQRIDKEDVELILELFEFYAANIADWFNQHTISWTAANIDFMLRILGYSSSKRTRVCGRIWLRMQIRAEKRRREELLARMFNPFSQPPSYGYW